ncbi:MAG: sensor histidine kinase [Myxococcota bacterium]
MLGHDLRSPLCAVRGFASLLARDLAACRTEQAERTLVQLRSGLDRLQAMLEGLLELGCIGSGTARPRWIPSLEAFRQVASELKPALEERGIELRFSSATGSIYADPIRFKQVLLNGVTNAIEHMGSVPMPVIQLATRPEPGGCALEVSDNGRGIPERALEGAAAEVDDREAPAPKPSRGLGLAIVRRIMEAHGGRVSVIARPSGGTCFVAFFPDPEAHRPGPD